MRVAIGGEEVLSKRYESFDAMSEEYIDNETEHGRRVPEYEPNAFLMAIAIFVLDKAYDEFRGWLSKRRERQESQEQSALEAERYRELRRGLDEVLRTTKDSDDATESPSRKAQVYREDKDRVLALLKWSRENNVDISITIETDAEGDLKEAFDTLMEQETVGTGQE